MSKVSLTLGESKTKVDLNLELKGARDLTLEQAPWTLEEDDSTLLAPKITLTKEQKTKDDLDLESK